MGSEWHIDDFSMIARNLKLLKGKHYFEHEPMRSYLFEVLFGEIHNCRYNIGDHKLADRYAPDIFAFTIDDVMRCLRFEDLPEDWQIYTVKCIEKYFENKPKK